MSCSEWIIGADRGGVCGRLPWPLERLVQAGMASALLLFLAGCGSDSGTVTDPGNGGGGGDPAPTPAIALTLAPTGATVEAGSPTSITATVSRSGGFTGSVAVEVQGLPSGVTASVGDAGTSGTTSTFAVALETTSTAAAGSYELTIRASGTGVAAVTRPFALALTAPPPDGNGDGNGGTGATVTMDFSACLADDLPLWVGYQDGSAAWNRAEGSGTVFTFPLTAAVGAYAWVSGGGGRPITQVIYLTRSELLEAQPVRICVPPRGDATMTGTLAGVDATQIVGASLGQGFGIAPGAAPQLEITGMPEGTFDLVAFRASLSDPRPDRFLIRRDVEGTDGGSLGTVDFGGSEAFAPATAQLSVAGAGAQGANALMGYASGNQCLGSNAALGQLPGTGTGPTTLRGIPADRQRDGDFHQLTVSALPAAGGAVVETRFFRTLADQTVTLPPLIDPTTSHVAGPYRRMRTTFAVPDPYRSGDRGVVSLTLLQGEAAERTFSTAVSLARVSGTTAEVTTTDLSGAPGWSEAWGIPAGASVRWTAAVTATSAPGEGPGSLCVEGAWVRVATVQGGP